MGAEEMAPGPDDGASFVGDAGCNLGDFVLNQFVVVGSMVLLMETG